MLNQRIITKGKLLTLASLALFGILLINVNTAYSSRSKTPKLVAFSEVFDIPKGSPLVFVNNATTKSIDLHKILHLRGQIMNLGKESVTVHAVVVTFYDMAGNVGGSAPFPVFPSVVNPGQTVPFDVTIADDKKTPFNPFTDTSQVKYQIDWSPKVEQ